MFRRGLTFTDAASTAVWAGPLPPPDPSREDGLGRALAWLRNGGRPILSRSSYDPPILRSSRTKDAHQTDLTTRDAYTAAALQTYLRLADARLFERLIAILRPRRAFGKTEKTTTAFFST